MLGKALQKARKEAGMSQEALAARASVDRSYISEIEREVKSPTVKMLIRLCRAMGISAGAMVSEVEAAQRGQRRK